MEFHIARAVRERYGFEDHLFSYTGNVIFANIAASRELANRINRVRGTSIPGNVVHAGALFAMGLIDELSHALVAHYRKAFDPDVLPAALRWLQEHQKKENVDKLLLAFTQTFPNVAIFQGKLTAEEWLQQSTNGVPNREAALEELILLWLANINPAFAPFKELFDDKDLQLTTVYKQVTKEFDRYFATRPRLQSDTLLDVLRAPMLASPDSLGGQLAIIRERWSAHLGEEMRRVLLAIDILKEEDIAIWLQFHPPSESAWHARQADGWGAEGFEGNEFVGFAGRHVSREAVVHEYEAFSQDDAWMPLVVLIAKSTYVWLEQLSKKYGRHIARLDQIPDEELALLADRGLNGLWLIGLWERSVASQTIKRMRGQADAVASAYSLRDYVIAEDLGGPWAYENLRDRAARFGIRLASDMVPNHMGIDSRWVIEHPEWFLFRWDTPYPSYSFEGPDLSNDSRVEIKIEDHYYNQTDAAVVFRRRDRLTGRTEYIYHGNDGTTYAWNDTAQLNYLKAEVREQVIQTILHVARQFPIIRFDAAMTLAKKHVQRLWFPLPGSGGAIPSRAESSMSQEEFDALMPNEFWREVVDRVAAEVPGTLLLAEAFWLLEGYFVRTLGMHRVYNSAFMNMLRDEENAKYRSYLKKTIEFDPDILKRYVNFMSNPDERTAIDQFGTGDKYFGACTLMATLPGLPMFGHGQIEGFTEKYGMEYKRARYDESPNEDLVARHQREIAPLLKNRHRFAESDHFVLFDFWTPGGTVDENVFAYSNRAGDERSIVLFHNRYSSTQGTLHVSAASMDKATGSLRQRKLTEALHLPSDDSIILAYEDTATGLKYLHRSTAIDHHGLHFELHAYQYAVLQYWRELRASAEQPWGRLCDELQGKGVHDLDEALLMLQLKPVHQALREVIHPAVLEPFIAAAEKKATEPKKQIAGKKPPVVKETEWDLNSWLTLASERAGIFYERMLEAAASADLPDHSEDLFHEHFRSFILTAEKLPQLETELAQGLPVQARRMLPNSSPATSAIAVWAPVLAWGVLSCLPKKQSLQLFDSLRLRTVLADIFLSFGLKGEDTWRAAARVRILLALAENLCEEQPERCEAFWADPDVRWLIGVNEADGKAFFNQESFEELLWWLQLPKLTKPSEEAIALKAITAAEGQLTAAFAMAGRAGYEVKKYRALLAGGAPGGKRKETEEQEEESSADAAQASTELTESLSSEKRS